MELALEKYLRPLLKTSPLHAVFTAAVIALLGLAIHGYMQQLTVGLEVTGMNAPTYWGLYIVNFVFFIGLSAGGIIIASLVHAFGIERFRSVARIAELMSISCLLLAMVFITLDVGRPDRLYHLLLYPRFESPLVWDVTVISLYLVVGIAYGYFGTRADLVACMYLVPSRRWLFRILALGYTDVSERAVARDRKILRALAVIGLPLAVALHSVTAWILGLVKAQPGWYSALLAPLFVVSAIVSGLGLLIVSVVLSKRFLKLEIKEGVVKDLGTTLLFSIPVLGYLLFAELLTSTYAKEPSGLRVVREIVFGPYALIFWGNLILGLIFPLLVLAKPRRMLVGSLGLPVAVAVAILAVRFEVQIPLPISWVLISAFGFSFPPWAEYLLLILFGLVLPLILLSDERARPDVRVGIAAALVVLGVLAERWNFVIGPLLAYTHLPYPQGNYTPTSVELMIVLGVYALGGLFFVVVAKLIPLVELEEAAR